MSPSIEKFDYKDLCSRLGEENPELVKDLLDTFIDDTYKRLNQLDLTDRDKLQRQLHTIKGAAGNVSAFAIQTVAIKYESDLKSGKSIDIPQAIQSIKSEVDQLVISAQEFLELNND